MNTYEQAARQGGSNDLAITNHSKTRSVLKTITASELMAMDIEPTAWTVPGLLPKGLTILGGSPKVGKSWLCLSLCLAVATGTPLGSYRVRHGSVLYLALEDGEQRLKSRLDQLGADAPTLPGLHISFWLPRLNEDGLKELELWLTEHPDCTLVVIDTWARIAPSPERANSNLYLTDYQAVGALQQLALKRNVSILLVHHLRKQQADDPLDSLNGTTGIAGAADALWIVRRKRGEQDATMVVTGRDVEERTIGCRLDDNSCHWVITGDVWQEKQLSVFTKLQAAFGSEPFTYETVKTNLAMSITSVKREVKTLIEAGYVVNAGKCGKSGKQLQFALVDVDRPIVHDNPDDVGRSNASHIGTFQPFVQASAKEESQIDDEEVEFCL